MRLAAAELSAATWARVAGVTQMKSDASPERHTYPGEHVLGPDTVRAGFTRDP